MNNAISSTQSVATARVWEVTLRRDGAEFVLWPANPDVAVSVAAEWRAKGWCYSARQVCKAGRS